ncbi:MAG: hypothetical protein JXA83_04630, partial [Acidimicrobiales bacterium]|nr:hypothetical protein [Acidimicrobiales bacterium]
QHNGTMGCPFHNRLWHRFPHLRPAHHQRGHPTGSEHAGGTPDAQPAHASCATSETINRRTGHRWRGCRTRPRPPDLIVTEGDASYEITLDP